MLDILTYICVHARLCMYVYVLYELTIVRLTGVACLRLPVGFVLICILFRVLCYALCVCALLFLLCMIMFDSRLKRLWFMMPAGGCVLFRNSQQINTLAMHCAT